MTTVDMENGKASHLSVLIHSWYHEGGTYLLKILQMLVRIFIQTSNKIQLSNQGYEIQVNLIPLSFDRV